MTTAAEQLVALAGGGPGTAGALLMSIQTSGVKIVFAETICVVMEDDRIDIFQDDEDITITEKMDLAVVEQKV